MAYLTELAAKHVKDNDLKGRTPIYSAARFVRLIGDLKPDEIQEHHLRAYREKCVALQMSARTIESSIGNIVTVLRYMTGKNIPTGRRLRLQAPQPCPAELDWICAVWSVAPAWLRLWIAFGLWTGLRLTDSIEMLRDISGKPCGPVLRKQAGKTGRFHQWPAPEWLRKMIAETAFPQEYCLENTKKFVRSQLLLCCEAAGCQPWSPKQLRQRSITEWSRANATAGAIVHGCGLGVLSHYLDPLQILESAAPRVRLPECFGATSATGEESLLANFRRLDQSAQDLIAGTAERLASG